MSADLATGTTGGRVEAPAANVMLLVPDITAGTGTEFQETLVRSGSGGAVAIGRSAGESPFRRWVSFRALSENL